MKIMKNFFALGLILSLVISLPINADGANAKQSEIVEKTQSKAENDISDFKYYTVHALTDLVTSCAFGLPIVVVDTIWEQNALKPGPLAKAALVSWLLAGWCVAYKTPEWTDKYVLRINERRTTKEKIASFLLRAFNDWLFVGSIAGEVVYRDNMIEKRGEKLIGSDQQHLATQAA